ncbi:MAG TPA: MFS transporter [Phenylobacterium sp.]|nr:MFS transporter [Phenylobacterium sp.]
MAVNAATYLISAAFLGGIAAREAPPQSVPGARRPLDGVRTGLAAAWAEPRVRPLLVIALGSGLFGGVFSALYIVFALRTLHLSPALLGFTIATGGGGALLGSLIARSMARALGVGPAIITAALASAASGFLISLAPGAPRPGMAVLVAAQILGDCFGVVSLILAVSARQALLPQALLGRTGAAFQAAMGGMAVAGALAGGLLGETLGVRAALALAAVGLAVAPAFAAFTPLRGLRKISGP